MALLIGSDVPGLLPALEQALGGTHHLTLLREAEAMASVMHNPSARLDAVILSDTMVPKPGKDRATSLWELVVWMSRSRQPKVPVIVTLHHDTPEAIQTALRDEVRTTGGDLQVITPEARTPHHPEAQRVVAWILDQLTLEPLRHPYLMVATSNAGGSGKTTTVMHLCLYLVRRGLRVLAVDFDIGQGALVNFFQLGDEGRAGLTTLPDAYPHLVTSYPRELVEQRIIHHRSGLDLLCAGQGVRDPWDISTACLEGLIATLDQLAYDVVCVDLGTDWKSRPVIVSLLTRRTSTPIVVCPPGHKERMGALSALEVLGKLPREDGRLALDAAMLVWIAGARGHVMDIRTVRREVLGQYPHVPELGLVPHDPALLSMAAERVPFCSAFDLAPRRPYCQAIRHVARRWMDLIALPPAWLTRVDPDEAHAHSFWTRWAGRSAAPAMPLPSVPDATTTKEGSR
ncbi:MinD/ParA family ATP-binding protein [Candidatus Chloroploca asiatica]|uniref:CobQ/CobB/MinD/ParA nucleotide binding domain-containing protein n=1 Tax=Candidatus Chloroploca asiatica TaxID=1506545 RepID=A0A2H3KMZ0_9CHLR|nr:division plane positioning ATPase MipZ [Candidatus Chloroploca asiatica]PDV96516.1 hypothetical protein A9Q02_20710 [Candidatus Chloroploca asiatica]